MSWCAYGVPSLVICALLLMPAEVARGGSLTPEDLPGLTLPLVVGWIPTDRMAPAWQAPPLTLDAFELVDGMLKLKDHVMWEGVLGGTADIELVGLEFDPDPFVLNNILVTNTSATTQTYTIGTILPTTFAPPSLISGSITTQAIDGGSDGAVVAALPGGAIYKALIDGLTVATMQEDVFLVTAPAQGVNNALDNFGPTVNALAVNSFIGITLTFTLTPGDTASILSRFDVVEIPEPATLSLLVLAGVTLLRRR